MSYYNFAFTAESPLWACHYGVTTHPLYHKCDKCPDKWRCDKYQSPPLKVPADCPHIECVNCGKKYFCPAAVY